MTLEITDPGNYFLDGCGFAALGIFFLASRPARPFRMYMGFRLVSRSVETFSKKTPKKSKVVAVGKFLF